VDTTSIRTDSPESGATDEDPCFACYEGLVYIGHLLADEHGEETEVIEAVPCRRCADSR
jgi:hypothetical protein